MEWNLRSTMTAALVASITVFASACYKNMPNYSQAALSQDRYAATAGRYYGRHYRPFVGGGGSPTIALARHDHHEWW